MQVTFSPALGETIPLVVHSAKLDVPLDVTFKATFGSPTSYEHAEMHNTRVEMWTDLPVEGRANDGWSAVPFTFEASQSGAHGELGRVICLPSPAGESTAGSERCVAYAKVALRAGSFTDNQRFSFTYRLVHASGHIQWLGAFGQDGTLVVNYAPFPNAWGIELHDGWQMQEDGVASFQGRSMRRQEVGRLSDSSAWRIWAIGRDSLPVFFHGSEVKPCAAMILTTGHLDAALVRYPPIVLSASTGASISVETDGCIVCYSDSASFELALCIMDDIGLTALTDCDVQIRLLGSVPNPASARIIACHAPGAALPLTILVLPWENRRVDHFVPLDIHALVPILPAAVASRGFVVTASNGDFWVSSEHEQITIGVGAFGGVAFVAPLYGLAVPEAISEHSWQVAVLQPHADARVITVEELVEVVPHRLLPTPPPSPPITMRAAQHPPPLALASLTEKALTGAQSSASSTATSTPTVTEGFTSALPESTTRVRSDASDPVTRPKAEVADMRVWGTYSLSSYARMLLAMFVWIWRVIFWRFTSRWPGAAGAQVCDSGANSDNCVSTLRGSQPDAHENQLIDDGGEDAGEDTASNVAKFSLPPTLVVVGDSESCGNSIAQPEPHVPPVGSKTVRRLALRAHVPARNGKVGVLVRAPGAALSVADHLRFIFDDELLPEFQSLATQHGYELVQFDVSAAYVGTLTVVSV